LFAINLFGTIDKIKKEYGQVVKYKGDYAYVNISDSQLGMLDMRDPANPKKVAHYH